MRGKPRIYGMGLSTHHDATQVRRNAPPLSTTGKSRSITTIYSAMQ